MPLTPLSENVPASYHLYPSATTYPRSTTYPGDYQVGLVMAVLSESQH